MRVNMVLPCGDTFEKKILKQMFCTFSFPIKFPAHFFVRAFQTLTRTPLPLRGKIPQCTHNSSIWSKKKPRRRKKGKALIQHAMYRFKSRSSRANAKAKNTTRRNRQTGHERQCSTGTPVRSARVLANHQRGARVQSMPAAHFSIVATHAITLVFSGCETFHTGSNYPRRPRAAT